MNKLFVEDEISTNSALAFEPQYVPSNGAVSFEPSYILRNVSSQLGIVSSSNFKETMYDSAIVINQEQYCERGSISLTAALCDVSVSLGPVTVWLQSKIELRNLNHFPKN